jgi:hypothetical protein
MTGWRMALHYPENCRYPTHDGPTDNKIQREDGGKAAKATSCGNDRREKIKGRPGRNHDSEKGIVHVFASLDKISSPLKKA